MPRRILAALLSLPAPGMGHIVIGHVRLGLAIAAGALLVPRLAALAETHGPQEARLGIHGATLVVTICLYFGTVIDVFRRAGRPERGQAGLFGRRSVRALLCCGLLAAALAVPAPRFPLEAYSLGNARSMLPLLAPGTRLLADHNAYTDATPRIGDIIVFYPPLPFGTKGDIDIPFVSRVAGLAGDTVQLPDQSVGCAKPGTSGEPPVCDVEEGFVYVAATNPEVPLFFFVPLANVIGRAEFFYWPPSRMGRIEGR